MKFLMRGKISGVLFKLHNRLANFHRYSRSGGFVASGAGMCLESKLASVFSFCKKVFCLSQ